MIVKSLGKIFLSLVLPIVLFAEVKFEAKLSKDKIYLNETIKLDMILTADNFEKIDQTYFEELFTDDFWIKRLEYTKPIKNKENTIYKYEFLLEPKVVGMLTLPSQFVEISSKKLRASFKRWHKVYAKEKKIEVLPLYDGITIQGKYTIEVKVDKEKVKANEPINVTLIVKGSGNIKDMKSFDLGFKDKIVYSDVPKITSKFQGGSYSGEFIQKFSIIADKSFSLPAIKFRYFHMDDELVKTISTKPKFIEVTTVKKDQKDDPSIKYIFGVIGIILGIMLFYLFGLVSKKREKKSSSIVQQIKKAKNDKELYKLLLPYAKGIDDIMLALEENIYINKKNKIDKKEILKRLDVYN